MFSPNPVPNSFHIQHKIHDFTRNKDFENDEGSCSEDEGSIVLRKKNRRKIAHQGDYQRNASCNPDHAQEVEINQDHLQKLISNIATTDDILVNYSADQIKSLLYQQNCGSVFINLNGLDELINAFKKPFTSKTHISLFHLLIKLSLADDIDDKIPLYDISKAIIPFLPSTDPYLAQLAIEVLLDFCQQETDLPELLIQNGLIPIVLNLLTTIMSQCHVTMIPSSFFPIVDVPDGYPHPEELILLLRECAIRRNSSQWNNKSYPIAGYINYGEGISDRLDENSDKLVLSNIKQGAMLSAILHWQHIEEWKNGDLSEEGSKDEISVINSLNASFDLNWHILSKLLSILGKIVGHNDENVIDLIFSAGIIPQLGTLLSFMFSLLNPHTHAETDIASDGDLLGFLEHHHTNSVPDGWSMLLEYTKKRSLKQPSISDCAGYERAVAQMRSVEIGIFPAQRKECIERILTKVFFLLSNLLSDKEEQSLICLNSLYPCNVNSTVESIRMLVSFVTCSRLSNSSSLTEVLFCLRSLAASGSRIQALLITEGVLLSLWNPRTRLSMAHSENTKILLEISLSLTNPQFCQTELARKASKQIVEFDVADTLQEIVENHYDGIQELAHQLRRVLNMNLTGN
ncbi:hypothetical protein BLNAU_9449 [Blattamonas nauphoetae]|uniref:Uncharacterized protein n=1 Tax=Blattamonas nauphoetae TaxID=2049346 RepID=A0ABQ9XVS9_9EUKA|nr:hypothetical protein BLNAU_9449 [Blattamonas nauphoetae]